MNWSEIHAQAWTWGGWVLVIIIVAVFALSALAAAGDFIKEHFMRWFNTLSDANKARVNTAFLFTAAAAFILMWCYIIAIGNALADYPS